MESARETLFALESSDFSAEWRYAVYLAFAVVLEEKNAISVFSMMLGSNTTKPPEPEVAPACPSVLPHRHKFVKFINL